MSQTLVEKIATANTLGEEACGELRTLIMSMETETSMAKLFELMTSRVAV